MTEKLGDKLVDFLWNYNDRSGDDEEKITEAVYALEAENQRLHNRLLNIGCEKCWVDERHLQLENNRLEAEVKRLNAELHPIVYDYNIMKGYDEERNKEDLAIADSMAGGPIIRELESRLSRAQALPERWRKQIEAKITSDFKDGLYYGLLSCADELEGALGGVEAEKT